LGACASKTQTSGETHFVECDTDADCAALGADYSCQEKECKIRSQSDAGAGGTAGAGGSGGAASVNCGASCVPAYGYQMVAEGCIDQTKKEIIGCYCPGAPQLPGNPCHVRKSDGSTWWFGEFTSFNDPSAFETCEMGPIAFSLYSCDFSSCRTFFTNPPTGSTPPPSWCSREDTCKALGCGSLEFDENGCKRLDCTSDSDCPNTERCVYVTCRNSGSCAYVHDGTCQCAGPASCLTGRVCNLTSAVGPRGDWTALEFISASGPCPTPGGCTSTWRLTPDGNVAISKEGTPSTATMDAVALDSLRAIIDGPELRRDLRDGFTCDQPPTDINWQVKLELATETLQRDATGCLTTGPDGNIARQAFDYFRNF
jgi:hypothetical protein